MFNIKLFSINSFFSVYIHKVVKLTYLSAHVNSVIELGIELANWLYTTTITVARYLGTLIKSSF